MRIDPAKTQKESTHQVVLDALALTTCYPAFLITADVPKIYMHQFWFTINKKDSTSYRFKIDKKRFTLNIEVFKEIFQICPRLLTQEFDALPSDEEIVSFIKKLSHKGDIKSITEMLDSDAYKTYLAYATGATSPKMKRKFKKLASPSKKRTLVTVEGAELELDTPSVSMSKKKAPAKAERGKGIELLSDAALLEEDQLEKALKKAKEKQTVIKQLAQRNFTDIIKDHFVPAEIVERLRQQYAPQKSIEDIREIKMEHEIKHPKQRALYHALMESILKDEDAIMKVLLAGDTQRPHNLGKDTGNTDEPPVVNVDLKDWFKKPERPPSPDCEWNKGPATTFLKALAEVMSSSFIIWKNGGSTDRIYMTSLTKTKAAKYDLPRIKDMVPNLWSPAKVAYDNHALLGISNWGSKRQSFYGYAFNKEIEVRRSDQQLYKFMEGDFPRLYLHDIEDMLILLVQNRLFNLKGDVIVHLAAALRMFTRRIVIKKRVEDLQLGVESYQKKLNISRPMTHKAGITDLKLYSAYFNPQGFISVDKLGRNRLMCSHELYKFNDDTLISLCDTLKDMDNNLEMGYTSVMSRRR
nr:hypothetical protein [Tanacetum cinerariifolium]